ncbi:prepilin-type cleavage/methylation domain-containing protein [Verrucomicrobia bacterium LW23]|nr:prepilin-type cleavage/methylation domain-containing protein [Verrucomicrobia bacterium LW23]
MLSLPLSSPSARRCRAAFTLVEIMVSLAVLAVMLLVLANVTDQTSRIWRGTRGKIEAFQGARAAFETITQTLSQATLNTYYEYFNNANPPVPLQYYVTVNGPTSTQVKTFQPETYDRYSELHFLSGPASTILSGLTRSSDGKAYTAITSGHAVFFQAPLGFTQDANARQLESVLNGVGYFVEFGSDADQIPDFVASTIKPRFRYRLMQYQQPSESLGVYRENWKSRTTGQKAGWFGTPLAGTGRPAYVVAENVLLLLLRPKRSDKEYENNTTLKPLAPNYLYDSQPNPYSAADINRYQLPPLIEVTIVAIDEASAMRLEAKYGTSPPLQTLAPGLFTTTADTNDRTKFDQDMQTLEQTLTAQRINYRIFNTEVMIRSSKWSEN